MKGIITDLFIVVLVAANIFVGALNYRAAQPKCMCDNCSRVRVSGERYCREHEELMNERIICLEVKTRN